LSRPSINDDAKAFLSALRKLRERVGSRYFREHLGWAEARYWRAPAFLIEQGKIVRGRGRGGSVEAA
jgi:type I restriction enzyme M protein